MKIVGFHSGHDSSYSILDDGVPVVHNELERNITKAEETDLLLRFNKAVERISKREKINPTLFFSKKAQKDFLRLVFQEGIEIACEKITSWRSQLIKQEILNLLR